MEDQDQIDEFASEQKKDEKKKLAIESARNRLLRALGEDKIVKLQDQVAYILNHYPEARNSDQKLSIHLIETFYSKFVDAQRKISLESLQEIPKLYDMQRYRAKIQNDYGLFLADPNVRRNRKKLEEEAREAFTPEGRIASDIAIFADESGKTHDYVIVGSYWIYNRNEWEFFEKRFNHWRTARNTTKEFHFSEISKHDEAKLATSFFGESLIQTQLNAFVALVIERKGIPTSKLSKAIYDAFAEAVIQGVQSEFDARRISPPISISICKDADDDTDKLEIAEMERRILTGVTGLFPSGQASLKDVRALDSAAFNLVQVADLFTGTVNRWINFGEPNSEGNPKNLLAHNIGMLLGFGMNNQHLIATGDQCKILYLSDLLKTIDIPKPEARPLSSSTHQLPTKL
jgi:hypothetical protein